MTLRPEKDTLVPNARPARASGEGPCKYLVRGSGVCIFRLHLDLHVTADFPSANIFPSAKSLLREEKGPLSPLHWSSVSPLLEHARL